MREGRPEEGRKLLAAFARLQPVREQIEHYRYLLTLYPEDADAYYNLGVLYGGLGHREAAAGEYRRALAINPADLGARNNLANILLNTGQINAAIQQYEQLLAQYPRYAQGYNNLGAAYLRLGDEEAATRMFQKALWADPEYADAHYNLSMLYFRQGRQAEGQAALDKYRSLTKGKIDLLLGRARFAGLIDLSIKRIGDVHGFHGFVAEVEAQGQTLRSPPQRRTRLCARAETR